MNTCPFSVLSRARVVLVGVTGMPYAVRLSRLLHVLLA
jgi:hypothetical protein